MKRNNIIQNWIVENTEKGISAETLIKEQSFCSFGYRKYGQTVLSMEAGAFSVALIEDVGQSLHDGTLNGYKETREFAEYLGKRIALCLNFFKGKTNKEIEQCLKAGNTSANGAKGL